MWNEYILGSYSYVYMTVITVIFSNMQTLKMKGQLTNAFFVAVNQMLGGSF